MFENYAKKNLINLRKKVQIIKSLRLKNFCASRMKTSYTSFPGPTSL
jgi:hypothetical protein